MSQSQSQGLGGLTLQSTADLSGTISDVNAYANPVGSDYKNAVGLFAKAETTVGYFSVAGANAITIGVIQDTPKLGQAGCIQSVRGTTAKVISAGIIAVGARLQTDAYGRAVTVAGSGARNIVGIALEAATAAGQLIEAVLTGGYIAA